MALETAPSGATSTKLEIRFDLIPPCFTRRLALRYALGISKGHTEYNWRKGITDPVFIQSRINHLLNHLNLFLTEGNDKDDNLAAVAWCVAMLMEFEDHPGGKDAIGMALNKMSNYSYLDKNSK